MANGSTLGRDLRDAIDTAVATLDAHPSADTARPPAPGKWCAREILGHLIDSAVNNHRRFVIGQGAEALVFDGYAQNDWVARQRYRDVDWQDLTTLWRAYNLHLARVIEAIPDDALDHSFTHMLDRTAARVVPADHPSSLRFVVEDYLRHLDHHIGQIRALLSQ